MGRLVRARMEEERSRGIQIDLVHRLFGVMEDPGDLLVPRLFRFVRVDRGRCGSTRNGGLAGVGGGEGEGRRCGGYDDVDRVGLVVMEHPVHFQV